MIDLENGNKNSIIDRYFDRADDMYKKANEKVSTLDDPVE